MIWEKLQHIFVADKHSDWMYSHASNPVFIKMDGNTRIYFSCRDKKSRSHIAWVDVDIENGFRILNISKTPALSPGELGLFDDSGVSLASFQRINGELYMYYLGWNLKVTVPWMNTIGVAKYNPSKDSFEKQSRVPMMDRSEVDPYSISYPFVLHDNGIYRMWYGSNLAWGANSESMNHVIKYAESKDGLTWNRTGKIAIDLSHQGEYAISKPWVIKEESIYHMWYSYRGSEVTNQYRIGYASSSNGQDWIRKDDLVGIDVSKGRWDSDMMSYPCVFDYMARRFMLYNGNDYGKTGFGVAELSN